MWIVPILLHIYTKRSKMKYQSIVLLLILGCNSETNQAVGTLQEEFANNETDIAHLVEELEQLRGELEILQTEWLVK